MSIKESLRTILACVVLEMGVLMGAPMRPEAIRELMRQMNQPSIAHVLPDHPGGGVPPEGSPV